MNTGKEVEMRALFVLLLIVPMLTAWTATVVKVGDGDTITVAGAAGPGVRVRLYGIDCPESRQAYGDEATALVRDAVMGKSVEIEVVDVDRYRRVVGVVRVDGVTLQSLLLEAGLAWVYPRYCRDCRDWEGLEAGARARSLGLWCDDEPVPPWEWRRERRERTR